MKNIFILFISFLSLSVLAVPCNNAQKKRAVETCSFFAQNKGMTFNKSHGVKDCNKDQFGMLGIKCLFYKDGEEVTEFMNTSDLTTTKKDQCSEEILVLVNAACDANVKSTAGFKKGRSSSCSTNDAGLTSFQCVGIKSKGNENFHFPQTYQQYFSLSKH